MIEWIRQMLRRLRAGSLQSPPALRSLADRRSYAALNDAVRRDPMKIHQGALEGLLLSAELQRNLDGITKLLGDAPDLVVRRLKVGQREAAVVFFDTLARADHVATEVIKPLGDWEEPAVVASAARLEETLRTRLVRTADVDVVGDLKSVIEGLARGKAALFVDGFAFALMVNMVGFELRGVEEPTTEPVVRGPRDGFNENLHTNLSLVRRRLASPLLRFEMRTLGSLTQTKVAIAYLRGVANDTLVQEVRNRLDRIEIDGVLDTSYIEEFIEDTPFSVFPQILSTERPDKVVAALLEGKVAILCDGTPFALVVPTSLWTLMSAGEDHYQRWDGTTLVRLLRYVLVSLVLLLPSMYVAATTFHPEMLPGTMLISIAAARESVPFSSFTEVLAMEIAFEAVREAGIRLPRPVGQTIGIVGAIVMGEAAVEAQFVSSPVVIIVAFTGISSFVIPHFNLGIAIRALRFPILLLAGSLGLFGISIGLMLILLHLVTLHSFGEPYLAPISPLRVSGLKDTIVRLPRWSMVRRPRVSGSPQTRRGPHGIPPREGDE